MKKILLIIEKGDHKDLWGRVNYEDDLIVDHAPSVERLEKKMRKLLKDFHGLLPDEIIFEPAYDLTAFFKTYDYLKITTLARYASLNPSLLRQYVSGVKHPSPEQAKKIEDAVHEIGKELQRTSLYTA